jgi:hypothetical protein
MDSDLMRDPIDPNEGPKWIGSTRMARCFCGQECPSEIARTERAFFEDRGEGSRWATELCECGYAHIAHTQEVTKTQRNVVIDGHCEGFTPRGPHEFDSFYCGCRGWD